MHACVLRMEHDRSALLQPQTARIGQLYYEQHGSISSSCTILHVHAVKVVNKPISYDRTTTCGHHCRQVLRQQHLGNFYLYLADNYLHQQTSSTTTTPSSSTTNQAVRVAVYFILHNFFPNLFIYSSNKTAENLRYAPPITEISSASSSGSGSQGSWWSLSLHARY